MVIGAAIALAFGPALGVDPVFGGVIGVGLGVIIGVVFGQRALAEQPSGRACRLRRDAFR